MVGRLIGCEGYAHVGHLVDDPSLPVDPHVRPRIQLGRGVSARDYLHLLRECEQLKRDWAQALAGCDALLTPTTLTAAPRVADIDQSGTAAVFTRAINLVGGCALAVPNGFTRGGLPTSLQIACPAYQEATALRIGWALEQAPGSARKSVQDGGTDCVREAMRQAPRSHAESPPACVRQGPR